MHQKISCVGHEVLAEQTSPSSLLADAATLNLTNKKNGTKRAVLHNDAIFESHCRVQSLPCQVSQILAFTTTHVLDTSLSTFHPRPCPTCPGLPDQHSHQSQNKSLKIAPLQFPAGQPCQQPISTNQWCHGPETQWQRP